MPGKYSAGNSPGSLASLLPPLSSQIRMNRAIRALSAISMPLIVKASSAPKSATANTDHHPKKGEKAFVNPWPSYVSHPFSVLTPYRAWKDWDSKPVPPPEILPQVLKPTWGLPSSDSPTFATDNAKWKQQLKATWLGHACVLYEFPAPSGSEGRGPRVLFDPVFVKRCSPVQFMGPARHTEPPLTLQALGDLEIDAVVISHNHYDHMDITTLKHLYASRPKGSIHFFAPLGNASWFKSIGFSDEHVTELDWWDSRELELNLHSKEGAEASQLRVTCTPCQHFTGRNIHDRFHTLWASWAVEQIPTASSPSAPKVWFGGDTGYKSVPRGATTEEGLPTCPVFAEIGEHFGGFDLAMIPIGAYDPRWVMSNVHCAPEDSVEVHQAIKSKKSLGGHFGCWMLTCEDMAEPPKRLRAACDAKGISEEEFGVCNIGETVLAEPEQLNK